MYKVEVENIGGFKFKARAGSEEFTIDANGGGCTPPDALLASLGSCIGVYIRKYAEDGKVDIGGFTVKVEAEFSAQGPASFRVINVSIDLKGADIGERRKAALISFIKNCPVHNTLKGTPDIRIEIDPVG